jgi:transposase InsO family protein
MSKPRVIVLSVVNGSLTPSQAASRYGVTRQWVHQLLARYRDGGIDAVEPRSKKPRGNARAIDEATRERIRQLRGDLHRQGLDHGPVTIAWHLEREGSRAPSLSSIRRVLHAANLIVPQPSKRPRSSYIRFEAAQPNECWQSDFTHWQLQDGSSVEILNWLDDHSRYLLACTAFERVTGADVITTFDNCAAVHGQPASTLTDNALVYTARFRGGRNAFEYHLAHLGITQKNGNPSHPQTQGKVERFHQTLKRWLTKQPPSTTIAGLQELLDAFRRLYNHQRPHRALARRTPAHAYHATPTADPHTTPPSTHYRVRHDVVDRYGKLTLRRAGKLHHLGIGIQHAGKTALILADHTTITVADPTTGEILSHHTIEPDKNYWRNQTRSPGRWPGHPREDA